MLLVSIMSLLSTALLYRRLCDQQGMLGLLMKVTPGITKVEAIRRIGVEGSPLPTGLDQSRNLDVAVPPGGSALLFDSYRSSDWNRFADFVIVFDKRDRVVQVVFLQYPQ